MTIPTAIKANLGIKQWISKKFMISLKTCKNSSQRENVCFDLKGWEKHQVLGVSFMAVKKTKLFYREIYFSSI